MKAYCVICTDLFDEFGLIDVLPCGHMFHMECISKWLGQSHTCPECRKRYTKSSTMRLFFNFRDEDSAPSSNLLENQISAYKAQLSEKNILISSQKTQLQELRKFCADSEECASEFKNKYLALGTENKCLQMKLKQKDEEMKRVMRSADEIKQENEQMKFLKHIRSAIEGSQKETDEMLQTYQGPEAIKGLAATCSLLKRETVSLRQSKETLKTKVMYLEREIRENRMKIKKQEAENQELVKNLLEAQAQNVVLKRMTDIENSCPDSNENDFITPQRTNKRHADFPRSPLAESETPEVTKILPGAPKKFKVTVPKFEKVMKIPVSRPLDINLLPLRRDDDDDSVTRSGYNGLGGHSKTVKSFSMKRR